MKFALLYFIVCLFKILYFNGLTFCRLYDASNNSVITRYEIQRIMYYDNGPAKSKENSCFAFTYCLGDTQETALFHCHVFRCDIPEAVSIIVVVSLQYL